MDGGGKRGERDYGEGRLKDIAGQECHLALNRGVWSSVHGLAPVALYMSSRVDMEQRS